MTAGSDTPSEVTNDNLSHRCDSVSSGPNGDSINETDQPRRPKDDIFESLKPKRSKWTPHPGQFSALDHYIDKYRREGNQLHFKRKHTRCYLTPGEQEALRRLQSRTDVIFRPADKGGAFIVWSKDLCLAEAYK